MQLSGCPNTFSGANEVDDHCAMLGHVRSCHVMSCYHLSPTVTPQFGRSNFVSTLLHSQTTSNGWLCNPRDSSAMYLSFLILCSRNDSFELGTLKYCLLFSNGSQKQ